MNRLEMLEKKRVLEKQLFEAEYKGAKIQHEIELLIIDIEILDEKEFQEEKEFEEIDTGHFVSVDKYLEKQNQVKKNE